LGAPEWGAPEGKGRERWEGERGGRPKRRVGRPRGEGVFRRGKERDSGLGAPEGKGRERWEAQKKGWEAERRGEKGREGGRVGDSQLSLPSSTTIAGMLCLVPLSSVQAPTRLPTHVGVLAVSGHSGVGELFQFRLYASHLQWPGHGCGCGSVYIPLSKRQQDTSDHTHYTTSSAEQGEGVSVSWTPVHSSGVWRPHLPHAANLRGGVGGNSMGCRPLS
jgi:hypothetical protein